MEFLPGLELHICQVKQLGGILLLDMEAGKT